MVGKGRHLAGFFRTTASLGILYLLLSIVLVTFFCFETTLARAAGRTVIVGVYENAPKVFTSESGKPAGIFIDIIEHIAKNEGWKLRYLHGTWGEGLDRLAKGEIDLMPDVAYSAEREKIFAFNKTPVLSSWYQVYAPKGSNIHSLLDLNKKRILVLERSVQQAAFIRLSKGFGLNITVISVPDYNTMFEMVAKGEADAALTNGLYGKMHEKKFGLEDTAIVFEPSDLFFAATKGDPKHLLEPIERCLSGLKKDPQSIYYASLKRYISEEIRFKLPPWLKVLAVIVGIALFISVVGSFFLKHQVRVRTQELQQINQEMEQRIAQRTKELTAANSKLKELDQLKSMFIASMSHELRTPLNSIIGFTGMTLQGLSGDLNDEQKDNLARVYKSAKHLLALISDVIDISKIEAGRVETFHEKISLKEIVEEAVASVEPQMKEKGLALEQDIPADVQLITDRKRLLQCLLNFLSNAVKFTESGKVSVTSRELDGYVDIAVSDTGIGISENDIPKLFEAFERLDSHLRVKAGGTGLGLYLTKKLVTDVLQGDVSVQSREGEGSTFSLRVPLDMEQVLDITEKREGAVE
ncbi:MAG: ATP-binding protein [Geobacteraceae bacterium]|nr:ATP-binding protein [Geobacteraceae bacterium]